MRSFMMISACNILVIRGLIVESVRFAWWKKLRGGWSFTLAWRKYKRRRWMQERYSNLTSVCLE